MSAPQPPCGHLDVPRGDPVADRLGFGAVALRYAALGLPVFPLVPGTKKPDCEHGFKDATTDRAVIEQWWTEDLFRGIGIATGGSPLPCGIVPGLAVVDLDRTLDRSRDGLAAWEAWTAGLGLVLPWTPGQDTPRNGEHLCWRLPPGRTMTSRTGVLPGVDVRADGGYIAAWPTRIAVRFPPTAESPKAATLHLSYSWRGCPCQAPVMPAALFGALASLPGTSTAHGGHGGAGGGHDGQVAATVLADILRGLSKEQCYEQWLKTAVPQDPSRPFRRADFERHYGDEQHGALAKANAIRAAEAVSMPEIMAWAHQVNRQARDRTQFERWARREARS